MRERQRTGKRKNRARVDAIRHSVYLMLTCSSGEAKIFQATRTRLIGAAARHPKLRYQSRVVWANTERSPDAFPQVQPHRESHSYLLRRAVLSHPQTLSSPGSTSHSEPASQPAW